MAPEASWQSFFSLALSSWREREGESRAELPEWLPGGLIERLGKSPIECRSELLELLRQRSVAGTLELVHPTWVVLHLPTDALLCRWAVMSLPAALRLPTALLVSRRVGDFEPGSPPPWFAGWWRRRLAQRLDYPAPMPWTHAPDLPISWLWRLPVEPLQEVLLRYGLRPLAAVFAKLDARDAARLAYTVAPPLRDRLVGLVRGREHPDTEPWFAVYQRWVEVSGEPAELPLRMALLRLASSSSLRRQPADFRRLAYRLPTKFGQLLFDDPPAGLPSSGAGAELGQLVGDLVAAGELEIPGQLSGSAAETLQ